MKMEVITPRDTPKILRGPLAGKDPFYLFLFPKKDKVLASSYLFLLLEDLIKNKEVLRVNDFGFSFLLQSGFIPPPLTIFENFFVLYIGDWVEIQVEEGRLKLNFFHQYPFFHAKRNPQKKAEVQEIFKLLLSAIKKEFTDFKPIYLFQSAGKDSNTLALVLARSDLKDLTTCITLKDPFAKKDESEVAKELAKRLGLRHEVIEVPNRLPPDYPNLLQQYFSQIPFPCLEGIQLAYPLYAQNLNLKGSYLIDGSGNDIYLGHVPRKIEYQRQKVYPKFNFLRPLAEFLPSGHPWQKCFYTRCELAVATGFTYKDTRRIYSSALPVYPYWQREDQKRKSYDYFDLKGEIWGCNMEYFNVIQKARFLAQAYGAKLILPWTNEEVALYFAQLSEDELFDRKNFKNKLFIRKILKEYLDFDVDRVGKFSYPFNAYRFLLLLEDFALEELKACPLWEKKEVLRLYQEIKRKAEKTGKKVFKTLLLRLFLISLWANHSKYLRT